MLISSKLTMDYIKHSHHFYLKNRSLFKQMLHGHDKPYNIGFHFVRSSRRKYDWVNPVQTVQDIIVKSDWVDDDNIDEMYPVPLSIDDSFTSYNKEKPGVFISLCSQLA